MFLPLVVSENEEGTVRGVEWKGRQGSSSKRVQI